MPRRRPQRELAEAFIVPRAAVPPGLRARILEALPLARIGLCPLSARPHVRAAIAAVEFHMEHEQQERERPTPAQVADELAAIVSALNAGTVPDAISEAAQEQIDQLPATSRRTSPEMLAPIVKHLPSRIDQLRRGGRPSGSVADMVLVEMLRQVWQRVTGRAPFVARTRALALSGPFGRFVSAASGHRINPERLACAMQEQDRTMKSRTRG